MDCEELQGDQTLRSEKLSLDTIHWKIFTWEKNIAILPILQTVINNFPTASGRKNANARKMRDGIL